MKSIILKKLCRNHVNQVNQLKSSIILYYQNESEIRKEILKTGKSSGGLYWTFLKFVNSNNSKTVFKIL